MRILSVPTSPTVFGSVSISHTANADGAAGQAAAGNGMQPADRDAYTWEALWGDLNFTGTVDENGTVTETMNGSVNIANPERAGCAAFSVSVAFHPDTCEPEDLKKTVDSLAAAYKITAAAVRCASTGESIFKESKEGNRLELVYQERKAEASDSFSRMVGGYLESCNQTGQEEQKVRDSVQALFTAYEEKYQAVMEKNPQAAWTGGSLFASIINLQKMGTSFPVKDAPGSGLYSLRELEAVAARVCRGFSIQA